MSLHAPLTDTELDGPSVETLGRLSEGQGASGCSYMTDALPQPCPSPTYWVRFKDSGGNTFASCKGLLLDDALALAMTGTVIGIRTEVIPWTT